MLVFAGILAMVLLASSSAAPTDHVPVAVNYLAKYGYMRQSDADNLLGQGRDGNVTALPDGLTPSPDVLQKALLKFQTYANITATGELDDSTLEVMRRPRCGFKDFEDGEDYSFIGGKWTRMPVTYRTTIYTPDLPRSSVDSTFNTAFSRWDAVCGISFRRITTGTPDIVIYFGARSHGDPYPFDGPSGVLAHAFNPGTSAINGDTHFDEDERWTLGTYSGINLYQVALHEFGHALGLGHSTVTNAVMYAFYTGYKPTFALAADDIAGCRALYGP